MYSPVYSVSHRDSILFGKLRVFLKFLKITGFFPNPRFPKLRVFFEKLRVFQKLRVFEKITGFFPNPGSRKLHVFQSAHAQ